MTRSCARFTQSLFHELYTLQFFPAEALALALALASPTLESKEPSLIGSEVWYLPLHMLSAISVTLGLPYFRKCGCR
ncbi:hypothetical protein F5Y16DRAFT_372425 [Xylariaceae sp. FL0255]|nr:hypothetical protein F5Y16DRAFT_372425 [Xylariaceae sp. FL0255]